MAQRVAILSGGAGELGRALVAELLRQGYAVMATDSNDKALEALAAAHPEAGDRLATRVTDATDQAQVEAAVAEALSRFGRIDALANVAGGAGPVRARHADEIDLEAWTHVIDLNLKSAFLFSRSVLPAMRRQKHGRIVNFSSSAARGTKGPLTTVTGRLPYATSKAALIGMTAQMAKDLAEEGITVNAVMPGLVLGAQGTRIRTRFEALTEPERAGMIGGIPMGRAGVPEEVAAVVAFLFSEAASYVSGVALPIDGAAA
ncbi:SDR family oxidoreductase [Siccirubricoccus sp. KC 17139]|uniref:SDR family oxidoreductase n=1 Tax=Siccirubricoccus soli TaxID=2899147 RepID=A0ABT1D6Y3_9PROT|nr:SDR family NAD(P)-dependent oxidoreductase [Siccirubricoccus soli]MCO6417686.1 SDR family oxidoreductase [Siccirubricoccus soli]MCP2683821.1 SDR family oxidoreductase [Siccirubricoccus soli]